MYQKTWFTAKKLKKAFIRSVVSTLIFLFLITPLAPVFAAETASSAAPSLIESVINSLNPDKNSAAAGSTSSSGLIPPEVMKLLSPAELSASKTDQAKAPSGSLADNSKKPLSKADSAISLAGVAELGATEAADVSGKSANNPDSPKGAGIPEPDKTTGALTYSYPVEIPPGRNGFQPGLSLSYNSQSTEEGSIFGRGWSAGIPSIGRINRKGTDKLYTEKSFYSSLSGEIVNISGTSYGAKVDNGEFLKYTFTGNAWTVTDKKGTIYKFGATAAARQDDPSNTANAYKWMLEEIRDTNSNYIRYEYFKDAGQIYPSKIFYTGSVATDGIFEVEFLREARADALSSYQTGFLVKTNFRINEINAKVSGSAARKYALSYGAGENGMRSLLKSITKTGIDEAGVPTTLPATTFEYQGHEKNWTENTTSGLKDFPLHFEYNLSPYKKHSINVGINENPVCPELGWQYYGGFGHGEDPSASPNGQAYIADFTDAIGRISLRGSSWGSTTPVYLNVYRSNTDFYGNIYSGMTLLGRSSNSFASSANGGEPKMNIFLFDPPLDIAVGDHLILVRNTLVNDPAVMSEVCAFGGATEGSGFAIYDPITGDYAGPGYFNSWVEFSTASGANPPPPPLPLVNQPNRALRITDINGDALPDMVYSFKKDEGSYKMTYLNTGNAWAPSYGDEAPVDIADNNLYPGTRLADINGDLLPDILKSDKTGYEVYLRTAIPAAPGSFKWEQSTAWTIPVKFVDDTGNDYGTKVIDVNGDGLSDIVQSSASALDNGVYLNTGTGWALNPAWSVPVDFGQAGLEFEDINNDGLIDILSSYLDVSNVWQKKVYTNTGSGWMLDASWDLPLAFGSTVDGADTSIRLADINADGYADIIRSTASEKKVYINTGSNWQLDSSWVIPDMITSGTNFIDIDGNGIVDLIQAVYTDPDNGSLVSSVKKFYSAASGKPDLLSKVKNTGASIEANYTTTALLADSVLYNPKLPMNLDIVSKIVYTADDGFSPVIKEYNYFYLDGYYYYNGPFDRKFTGFGVVQEIKTSSPISYSIYLFHQGDGDYGVSEIADHVSKAGKPYFMVKSNSSFDEANKTFNKWENYALTGGRNFVRLVQSTDETTDAVTYKDKAEAYTYSNTNGNLLSKTQWGEVIRSDSYGNFIDIGTDKFTIAYTYAANAALNISGVISKETMTNQSAVKIAESRYYYDALALGSAGKGNLTKQEQWRNTALGYINLQKAYNAYGLVTNDTDPLGKVTSYAYDSFNLYPITVTNPLLQAAQFTYDYSSGQVKQATDPNGYVVQTIYDGLDRVTEEKQSDLVAPATLVTSAAYTYTDSTVPKSIKKTEYADGVSSVDTYSYFDGLGRLRQVRREAEDANTFSVKQFVYCSNGSLKSICAEGLPYFSAGAAPTNPMEGMVTDSDVLARYTLYTYDALDRVVKAQNSTQTNSNTYAPWTVTAADSNGHIKNLIYDAYGNLVQVGEQIYPDAASPLSYTNYSYDGLGDLLNITDAAGNIRNFTYDALGRRLTSEDLHTPGDTTFGKWIYVYDASGNTTKATTPNGQIINYTYDALNRNLTEDYTAVAGVEVTSAYDTCLGGKGKLCSVSKSGATQTYEYNSLGLVSKETSTIDSIAYPTSYTYNRLGGNLSILNPDNSEVKYEYNTAGLLEKVSRKESTDPSYTPVVSNFNYSPLGQITYQEYANGTKTTNTYDPLELYRLRSKITTLPDTTRIQDLSYAYDPVGNITKITDNSQTNSAKVADYTYDSLDRLLTATVTNAANGANYSEAYAYDAIGNITDKNGVSYSYAGNTGTSYANPHAATAIGTAVNSYDKNGNLLSTTGDFTNTWDYNNRLTKSVKGTTTVSYAYDASGQRVKYTAGTSSTIYPSANYNVKGTEKTKHIFAGGQLLATISGSGAGAVAHSVATDHLTGSNVVTNSAGVVEEVADYYPYGEIRLDEKAGTFSEQRKYAGQELDTDTGLSYMNARYYSGKTGRFISQDPMALMNPEKFLSDPQQLNSYSYARNNPVIYTDKSGQCVDGVSTLLCVAVWTALTGIVAGTGLGFYGAYTDNPQLNIAGQELRVASEIGGSGLIQSKGWVNPYTGQKPLEFKITGGIDSKGMLKSTGNKPYSTSRPPYAKDQDVVVWESAKDAKGNVFDPETNEQLFWNRSKPRNGQWDMGHKPEEQYKYKHADYMSGKISKEEFLSWYRDPNNYRPQSVWSNRSGQSDN